MKRNLYLNIQEKEEARQKFLEKFQDGSAWEDRRMKLGHMQWRYIH